jgi:hypothetical protein
MPRRLYYWVLSGIIELRMGRIVLCCCLAAASTHNCLAAASTTCACHLTKSRTPGCWLWAFFRMGLTVGVALLLQTWLSRYLCALRLLQDCEHGFLCWFGPADSAYVGLSL